MHFGIHFSNLIFLFVNLFYNFSWGYHFRSYKFSYSLSYRGTKFGDFIIQYYSAHNAALDFLCGKLLFTCNRTTRAH